MISQPIVVNFKFPNQVTPIYFALPTPPLFKALDLFQLFMQTIHNSVVHNKQDITQVTQELVLLFCNKQKDIYFNPSISFVLVPHTTCYLFLRLMSFKSRLDNFSIIS